MAIKCTKCKFENPSDSKFCKECGTQIIPSVEIPASTTRTLETPKEEFTRGTTFAKRYEFMEILGTGGMGKVYKVFDKKIKEEVALKVLKPEIASDEKTIERFSSELKYARKIRHKNVCQMYDINEEEDTHYITMEYVPGEDLRSFIRRVGQLPEGKTISIAKQICKGLSEAHRLGVVHRDLKPQNIMIDKEGSARIMDFGIARSVTGNGITGAGMMIGTPAYMSPEQVEGKDVDQRSDIYSLGVILYEMATGRIPFEGDTPISIAMKHKGERPKDPRELNSQVHEDLSQLILKCLEKKGEKRYQTAEDLFSELKKIEKNIPTTDRIIPKRKYVTSKKRTTTLNLKKLLRISSIAIALVMITFMIWQLFLKREKMPIIPMDKPSLIIMFFENNTGDKSLDHLRKSLSDLLIADLLPLKQIKVLRGDQLINILSQLNQLEAKSYSSDILKKVADLGGASHILQGNYSRSGGKFRINIMLHEARTEELVFSERIEGKEDIFAMADDMASKIRANLKLFAKEIPSDIDKELAKTPAAPPVIDPKLTKIPSTPPVTAKKIAGILTDSLKELKVIVDLAAIRETPELEGKNLSRIDLDTVLKAEKKVGDWFKVFFEEKGVPVAGFIHEMVVEALQESKTAKKAAEGLTAPLKVKVIVHNSSIRATPELEGKVLAKVAQNTILESESKQGKWYKIIFENKGVKISGFIHEMSVEVVH